MPADRREAVTLAKKQVDVVGGLDQHVGPLGVPGVGHRGMRRVDAQCVRRGARSVRHLVGSNAQLAQFGRAQFERATAGVFDDMDSEAPLHATRPGKQDLHGLLEPDTGAGWAKDGEVVGTAAKLPIEHQERQAAELVAVQVSDQHRLDLVGVDLLLAQRGQLVALKSSSTLGATAEWAARAIQVWNRPPEPNASPLPTVVTRTTRSSRFRAAAGKARSRPVADHQLPHGARLRLTTGFVLRRPFG